MTDDAARPPEGRAALALPRPPGALRRFWRRHPWWVDWLIAAAYLVLGLLGHFATFLTTGEARPTGVLAALVTTTVLGTAVLLARRRHPWVTFTGMWVTSVISLVFDGALDSVGVGLAVYALAVYRSFPSAWIAFGTSSVVATVLAVVSAPIARFDVPSVDFPELLIGLFVVPVLFATLVGISVGGRRRYEQALLDRAERLIRERDQQARLATAAERARITREMHDVVAHSLSIMVTLSDGAEALAEKDAARARQAVREIGEVGRRSLTEMRRLLGALGTDDEETADGAPRHPQPGIADLTELIATFRTAGLPVAVESQGNPPAAAGAQAAIYRIVQEALTNALRYATSPSRVLVRLDYRGEGTRISVDDDGAGAETPAVSVGSGRGLIGMRERAQLYGGSMEAGRRITGGWRVHVTLPEARDDQ